MGLFILWVVPSNTTCAACKTLFGGDEEGRFNILSDKLAIFPQDVSSRTECICCAWGRQRLTIDTLSCIEKDMTSIESQERQRTGKTSKVLRLLSSSGGKHNVDELKNIRKEYGAQSKEYKNALTTLDK